MGGFWARLWTDAKTKTNKEGSDHAPHAAPGTARSRGAGHCAGVGFRSFIYALARRHALTGWVRNDTDGVHIEVEGAPETLDVFVRGIREEAPPLAMIETVSWRPCALRGGLDFHIEASREGASRQALVSPDVATCGDCLAELHHYPRGSL